MYIKFIYNDVLMRNSMKRMPPKWLPGQVAGHTNEVTAPAIGPISAACSAACGT